jgi:hypothetical protein
VHPVTEWPISKKRPIPAPLRGARGTWGDFVRIRWIAFAALVGSILFAQTAAGAMYKWVDEKGVTHYGDSIPPQYANKASQLPIKSSVAAAKAEPVKSSADASMDLDQQKAVAKRQLERYLQDFALLATYASEAEIEVARDREQRRNRDTFSMATLGLAKSKAPEDKRKLESLLIQGQQETDAINARFEAQKVRFRELTGTPSTAQATATKL